MNNFRIILVGLISALGLYLIIYAVLFTVCILSNRNELIKKTDEDSLKSCVTESMQKAVQEERKFSMKEEIELFKRFETRIIGTKTSFGRSFFSSLCKISFLCFDWF